MKYRARNADRAAVHPGAHGVARIESGMTFSSRLRLEALRTLFSGAMLWHRYSKYLK
jgi:hypothetical protein